MSRPESFDVPVAPVGGAGGGGSRRALAVVLVVGAALVAAVSVAVLDGTSDPSPRTALLAPTDRPSPPVARATSTRGPWSSYRAAERAERLPDLANVPLPDGPVPVFHRRAGNDLERLAWSPGGTELRVVGTTRGAFEGVGSREAVLVASPDGSRIALRSFGSFGDAPGDRLRVLTIGGRTAWTRDDGEGLPVAPIWSPDGRRLVLPGAGGDWRILGFGSEDEPTEVTIAAADLAPYEASGNLVPLGFSVDGRWVYAAVVVSGRPGYRPAARVSADDGAIDALTVVPTVGQEALAVEGRFGYEVDPLTGRRFISPGLALSAGPTDVRVYGPDGREAFSVRLATVLGVAWTGDGRLLAIETDSFPKPIRMRLLPIEPSGRVGEPLLETGPLTWASLAGVRDGHVLLALTTTGRDADAEAVILRLSDGATATLRLDPRQVSDLQFGGWLP